ncbi:MAG: 5'-nucleotidase C-terminal domain-containing protein [Bacteroidia bacterium]|jgi:2',3'-cyclic-nucleotide 2'-phosphodiesterase (5'-nucleotidase family)|nr:5'-nucleotidase C-terminal domain-containing protein [Bacteroidia bacterium]
MHSVFLPRLFAPFLLSALLLTTACKRHAHVTEVSVSAVELNPKTTQHDSATHVIIGPYKMRLDAEMNAVVARTTEAMPKEKDRPETLLGNFVADVVLAKARAKDPQGAAAQVDMCLLNNGGLRSSLPKGNVTRGDIFSLMPFDNEIVIVTISGAKMEELLKYLAVSGGMPAAGIKLGIRADRTPGKTLINGKPLELSRNYRVATSDYLSAGGDKMSFFSSPVKVESTALKIRDALLEHCSEVSAKNQPIGSPLDGRIYYE